MSQESVKANKVLKAIYELEKKRKPGTKITREMIIVKSWQMFPSDFSMRGFPQYPAGDLARRLLTNLKRENFISGAVSNYKITEKGKSFIEDKSIKKDREKSGIKKSSRHIEFEINRILTSKVFEYFSSGKNDFLETDLFEFLGTSARSFKDSNQTNFLSRYNLVVKEVIPFCEKNKKSDERFGRIVNLWGSLKNKFPNLLKK